MYIMRFLTHSAYSNEERETLRVRKRKRAKEKDRKGKKEREREGGRGKMMINAKRTFLIGNVSSFDCH